MKKTFKMDKDKITGEPILICTIKSMGDIQIPKNPNNPDMLIVGRKVENVIHYVKNIDKYTEFLYAEKDYVDSRIESLENQLDKMKIYNDFNDETLKILNNRVQKLHVTIDKIKIEAANFDDVKKKADDVKEQMSRDFNIAFEDIAKRLEKYELKKNHENELEMLKIGKEKIYNDLGNLERVVKSSIDDETDTELIENEEANEDINEEANEDINEEANEDVNEEANEDVNEEANEDVNEEANEDVNEEANNDTNEEANNDTNEEANNDTNEEENEDVNEGGQN